jgi:hypothetical protein
VQQILNVITPSETYDLVSLAELKMKLGVPDTDTSKDAMLQEFITNTSDVLARYCNRVFAYEEVEETFYQLADGNSARLYLSRWPVKLADIQAITQDGDDILPLDASNWVLEESTGTLYMRYTNQPWYGDIYVAYSGGYALPDGAPAALKFAAEAAIRESYMTWIRNPQSFGVRMIAHKENRVSYYGPNMFPTVGLPATWTFINQLLYKFMRPWV